MQNVNIELLTENHWINICCETHKKQKCENPLMNFLYTIKIYNVIIGSDLV